jgi:hypothetical protein
MVGRRSVGPDRRTELIGHGTAVSETTFGARLSQLGRPRVNDPTMRSPRDRGDSDARMDDTDSEEAVRAVIALCQPVEMVFRSLVDIEHVIRSSWSEQTCDPVDLSEWSTDGPARGQCAVTALVVQDLLGGELLLAEVLNADGSRQGLHYWNRLASGVEVDLTREQFTATEIVQEPRVVSRPPDTTSGRLAAQYRTLATAVRARLAPAGST